jgi:hypothetical protein
MREAVDEAESGMSRADTKRGARYVLHALAWGFANASTRIESAMRWNEEVNMLREDEK